MITKFKIFENINEGEPEVGDYVICQDDSFFSGEEVDKDENFYFLQNNIGRIYKIRLEQDIAFPYIVRYDEFNIKEFSRNEIIYLSKNKEDLEHIITAKKYNL